MKHFRLLFVVAGLAIAVGAAGASLAQGGVLAAPGSATSAAQDDSCTTRKATELDRQPDLWRCVGLAKFHTKEFEPEERVLSAEEQKKRASVPDAPEDEWGAAVSPDGRLYVQIKELPASLGGRESAPVNPTGKEEDTERATQGYRLTPFTVLGSDQRQRRSATTSYPWQTLTAIVPPGSTTSNCSGVLVGPRHVLTAGHCLYQDGAWFPNRKVAPGMNGINTFSNGLKNSTWYYSSIGWIEDEDPENDFAMIILEDRLSTANLGWFGTQVSNGASAWNFGYPGWWRPCAASPTPPQCSNFLYGMDGYATKDGDWFFKYTIDTQPGQSGSPVYKYNGGDRRVIGVHTNGDWGDGVNRAKRLRSTTINTICGWINANPSAYRADTCL